MSEARQPLSGWRPDAGSLSREKVDTLFLIITCALIMAPHSVHLPGWITQVSAALLAWRCWITFRGEQLPSRWLLLPVCLAVMLGVLLTYKTMLGRDTGVAMLVLLIAFKLLEMHAKRDAFVVVFLSFFVILMNFFYSQSVLTTLLMAVAVILVLTVQISFQYAHHAPPLRHRLRLAGGIVGLSVPLMLVLFILFPRFHGPFWGMPGQGNAGTSGLSNSMAPGNISKLALSSDVAFRVRFNDAVPPTSRLYWRGPVLGNFDGRTWTVLPPGRMLAAGVPGANTTASAALRTSGAAVRYRVTMEPSGQQSLFLLEMPASPPEVTAHAVRMTPDMQLTTRTAINQRVRYDASSYLQFAYSGNETALSVRDWLQLPAGFNPQAHMLAAQMLRASADPEVLVQRVLAMFREKNFRYTLEPPLLGQHTVDDFLFNTRAGFCEHYANAFVVLMRAMEIPARVVTGYQGGEMNQPGEYMTIRQSDAHAWAEVWLPQRGWVRIDPTAAVAPSRIDGSLRSVLPQTILGGLVEFNVEGQAWAGVIRQLRMNWDAVNNRWNQMVLDYSAGRQRDLLEALGFHNPDWRTLTGLMAAVLTLVMAAVGLPLLRNRHRRDPLESLYERFCRNLQRQGQTRALHEGPQGWRQRLQATEAASPEKLRAWCEFLTLYETMRYAGPQSDPRGSPHSFEPELSRLRKLLTLCR